MLSNKLALITGANSGIGLATAQLFAKEGAIIIAVDRDESVQNVIESLNSNVGHKAYVCDVSSSEQVNELFKNIQSDYPEQKVPRIIVNSAGITRESKFLDMSEKAFDDVINVNLKGTFLVSQAACRGLVAHFDNIQLDTYDTYASIINLSSAAAIKVLDYNCQYSASKAAVESLTRSIAKDMGKYKIRCNSVGPSFTRTPMVTNNAQPEKLNYIASLTPLKRMAEPIEIAELCLFLASDKSSFMTGSYLKLDGGITL